MSLDRDCIEQTDVIVTKPIGIRHVVENSIDATKGQNRDRTWEGLANEFRKNYSFPEYVITWEGIANYCPHNYS